MSLGLSIRLLLDALRHLGKRCDHHDSPDFHPQTAAIIKLSPQQTPETKTAQFLIQACVCGPLAPQAATWSLALHLAQGASTSTSKSTSSTLHLAQGADVITAGTQSPPCEYIPLYDTSCISTPILPTELCQMYFANCQPSDSCLKYSTNNFRG